MPIMQQLATSHNAHVHMLELHKDFLSCFGNKGRCVYYKHLYYVFKLLCKVDYDNNNFIHG